MTDMQFDTTYRDDLARAYAAGDQHFLQQRRPIPMPGRTWDCYLNLNLYLVPTLRCNARCRDCVGAYDARFVPAEIGVEDYCRRLAEALQLLSPVNPSISLVGGEPSRSAHLPRILEVLAEHSARKVVLDTNGTGFCDPFFVDCVNRSSIAFVNISRRHYEAAINQRLMGIRASFGNPQLAEVIRALHPRIGVRLQACLDADGLNSLSECVAFIEWAESLGVSSVAIAEPAFLPDDDLYAVNVVHYSNAHRVSLPPLLRQVAQDRRFSPSRQIAGPFYYEELYRCGSSTVVFKTMDYRAERTWREDVGVHYAVLHPDGRLTASWDHTRKVMLEPAAC